jgi:hypothetical protein
MRQSRIATDSSRTRAHRASRTAWSVPRLRRPSRPAHRGCPVRSLRDGRTSCAARRIYWGRVAPGRLLRGPHRSGRARLTHPALRVTGSLLVAARWSAAGADTAQTACSCVPSSSAHAASGGEARTPRCSRIFPGTSGGAMVRCEHAQLPRTARIRQDVEAPRALHHYRVLDVPYPGEQFAAPRRLLGATVIMVGATTTTGSAATDSAATVAMLLALVRTPLGRAHRPSITAPPPLPRAVLKRLGDGDAW